MTIDFGQAFTFLLVMARMTGMIVLSPILGRRNVPGMLSAGLALMLAVILTPQVAPSPVTDPNLVIFAFMLLKELFIGVIAGFVMQLFLSVLIIGGEVIDMQLGISMAKAFDPGTNASISVTSGVLNAMFILVFFITNNHLTFIRLMTQTFNVIPAGGISINTSGFDYIPYLFSSILIFSMKLCLPLVVLEVIVTMAVGIIMRIIPQINVFVVNIQFKLLIGFLALLFLVAPMTGFFENMITLCFDRIVEAWGEMLSAV